MQAKLCKKRKKRKIDDRTNGLTKRVKSASDFAQKQLIEDNKSQNSDNSEGES